MVPNCGSGAKNYELKRVDPASRPQEDCEKGLFSKGNGDAADAADDDPDCDNSFDDMSDHEVRTYMSWGQKFSEFSGAVAVIFSQNEMVRGYHQIMNTMSQVYQGVKRPLKPLNIIYSEQHE